MRYLAALWQQIGRAKDEISGAGRMHYQKDAYSMAPSWTPKVCKIMAQKYQKQPQRLLFYIPLEVEDDIGHVSMIPGT